MITWPRNPSAIQMLLLPCLRAADVQRKLWDMFDAVTNRFDNIFIGMIV